MNVLKFKLSGKYGHYKRLEGTTVKQTHTVPTITSIQGLIGAIIGVPRDSYYENFKNNFEIAIVPKNIQTKTIATLLLSTDSHVQKLVKNIRTVTPEKSMTNRQTQPIEYLVDPEYIIYVKPPEEYYSEFKDYLEKSKSVYTPYLGISECIADIEYGGEIKLVESSENTVHSIVEEHDNTNVIPSKNDKIIFEKMADSFTINDNKRTATKFKNIIINKKCNPLDVSTDEVIYKDKTNNYNIMLL